MISGIPDVIAAETTYTVTATDGTEADSETIVLSVRNPEVQISSDRPLVITQDAGLVSVGLGGTAPVAATTPPSTSTTMLTENAAPNAAIESLVDLENVPGTTSDVPRPLGDASENFSAVITVNDSELEDPNWTLDLQAPYDDDGLTPTTPTFSFDTTAVVVEDAALGLDFELPSPPASVALGPFTTNTLHTEQLLLGQVSDPLLAGAPDGEWTELGGVFYGIVEDFSGNTKLYAFTPADGATPASVEVVSDTNPSASDDPVVLGSFGTQLVFTALSDNTVDPVTRELFVLDPGTPSVAQIADLVSGDDTIFEITDLGTTLAFTALDAAGDSFLYLYDPAIPSVTQVSNTSGGSVGGDLPQSVTALGGVAFYTALDAAGDRRLYSFDPATETQDLLSAADNLNPQELTVLDGVLYLTAENANNARKLFLWDDASEALTQITDFQEDATVTDDPQNLLTFDGDLFFTAFRTEDGAPAGGVQKLHRYQPTAVPLRAELLTNTTQDSLVSDNISNLVVAGTEVVFQADNENGVRKLFSFNDATGEVRQVLEVNDDTTDDEFGEMQAFGSGKLGLVLVDSGLGSRDLGVYDTVNRIAYRAANTSGLPAGDEVSLRGAAGDNLFFTANDLASNERIYRLE